jgi:hypothetical protein
MRSDQGEPLLRMLFEHLTTVLPVFRGMACLAFGSELPAMNIRVTIRAGRLGLYKPEILMAGGAPCFGVSTHERKARFAMRKPRWVAHFSP